MVERSQFLPVEWLTMDKEDEIEKFHLLPSILVQQFVGTTLHPIATRGKEMLARANLLSVTTAERMGYWLLLELWVLMMTPPQQRGC